MAVKLASVKRRSVLIQWVFQGALLMVAAGSISACRPSPPTQTETPAPADTTQLESAQPIPSTEQTPADSADTTTAATLPNALVNEWQPLSDVLVAFGPMTVTPDQVQWGSGQTSPYRLISTEDGYLLELEDRPSFYDTQNQYIKLIPKDNTASATSSLEIAFYTDASQLKNDEYIMYGSYFAE